MSIFDYVCDSLCIDSKQLKLFSATAPHRYKVYDIPKRSGNGTRTIAHPAKQLKFVQRLVLSELEKLSEPHESAFAYIKKISIKDNAQEHVKNPFLLKMDFKDFFPSITPELMFQEYQRLGIVFNENESDFLSNILFFKLRRNSKLKLSIGAPSSPFISNLIMYHFDSIISEYCKANKIKYTRYADDLTFSSSLKNCLFLVPDKVAHILKEEGYKSILINRDKTIFSSKRHNRHVTGITLSNDGKLSIGRNKKRDLSAAVHSFSIGKFESDNIEKLKGWLSFAFFIEPDFKSRLTKKYGDDVLIRLFDSSAK